MNSSINTHNVIVREIAEELLATTGYIEGKVPTGYIVYPVTKIVVEDATRIARGDDRFLTYSEHNGKRYIATESTGDYVSIDAIRDPEFWESLPDDLGVSVVYVSDGDIPHDGIDCMWTGETIHEPWYIVGRGTPGSLYDSFEHVEGAYGAFLALHEEIALTENDDSRIISLHYESTWIGTPEKHRLVERVAADYDSRYERVVIKITTENTVTKDRSDEWYRHDVSTDEGWGELADALYELVGKLELRDIDSFQATMTQTRSDGSGRFVTEIGAYEEGLNVSIIARTGEQIVHL